MFFATSLGPQNEGPTAIGLFHLLAARFPSRDGAPSHELYTAMAEIVRVKELKLTPAAALDMLAQAGMLRFDAETDTGYFTA
jgi:hypothetical protein